MELNEMRSMWQAYDHKLEKTLKLNLHVLELVQTQKVRSKLTPLLWQRGIEIAFHSIAIVLLLAFLYNNFTLLPYAASAIVLIAFYMVAFVNCVKQINIINQMNYSDDIVTLQSSLLMLRTNFVNHSRLAVLCIPTFLAYPVVVSKAIKDLNIRMFADFDIIAHSNGHWWTAQLVASIVLIPACIWFYKQVTYKNIHKQWVKDFIQRSSGKRVTKAMEFINELQSLKK